MYILYTPFIHSIYTLYTFSKLSIYILYTPYIQSLNTLYTFYYTLYIRCIYTNTQYIVYVLSMHYSHALSRFYRRHIHVQLNAHNIPPPQGERENLSFTLCIHPTHTLYIHCLYIHSTFYIHCYLSARLLYFVITYYILFPLPHNIPPPQGGRGVPWPLGGFGGGGVGGAGAYMLKIS